MKTHTSDCLRYRRILHGCSSINLVNVSQHCALLIRDLLRYNIDERLGCGIRGALDLLEHPWFNQIHFSQLYQQIYHAPYLPIRQSFHVDETRLTFTASKQYEREFHDF